MLSATLRRTLSIPINAYDHYIATKGQDDADGDHEGCEAQEKWQVAHSHRHRADEAAEIPAAAKPAGVPADDAGHQRHR